jgi:hypothetical protein
MSKNSANRTSPKDTGAIFYIKTVCADMTGALNTSQMVKNIKSLAQILMGTSPAIPHNNLLSV